MTLHALSYRLTEYFKYLEQSEIDFIQDCRSLISVSEVAPQQTEWGRCEAQCVVSWVLRWLQTARQAGGGSLLYKACCTGVMYVVCRSVHVAGLAGLAVCRSVPPTAPLAMAMTHRSAQSHPAGLAPEKLTWTIHSVISVWAFVTMWDEMSWWHSVKNYSVTLKSD